MQHHLTPRAEGLGLLLERLLSVSYAVLPDEGEDSFAMGEDARGGFLCVADGCGGLGSRRYRDLGEHTGAYLASRLVTRAFSGWAEERMPMPDTPDEGRVLCADLERDLEGILRGFARKNCEGGAPPRIVGSMQRVLPTTLCAAVAEPGAVSECCFLWAGDSRGYILDADGLHQLTRDHARGGPDPFESLYRDVPLSNLASADSPLCLSMRRTTARGPCVLVLATDGAFGCLPTPMEFEMLLLQTLLAASSTLGWRRKLEIELGKLAHDDATILCMLVGFDAYAGLKQYFAPRRDWLRRNYITPVRRRAGDFAFAREKWLEYREGYDRTEGTRHEHTDWRI